MSPELEGKVVIVTGAGGGLGRAVAQGASALGARVLATDLDDGSLKAFTEYGADDVVTLAVDVSSERDVEAMFAFAVQRWGRVDSIVNNAAIMIAGGADELTVDQFDRAMAVNVRGTFLGCKHALLRFREQGGGGSIVNIASISAEVGLAGQAAYCASKGAVKMLTKQISVDYSAQGIRCNAVGPGSIDGDFLTEYLSALDDPQAARAAIVAAHPIKRLSQPEEVAQAVLFLISDRASFISGAVLMVDGGYTAA